MKKLEAKKQHDLKQKSMTKETLFDEILLQNTYTDIVDLVLKYVKSIKGTPQDLIQLLDYLQTRLLDNLHEFAKTVEVEENFEIGAPNKEQKIHEDS